MQLRGGHRIGTTRTRPGWRTTLFVSLAALVGLIASSCVPNGAPPPVQDPGAAPALPWLTAVRGAEAGVYDDAGRQLLLRGVNLNHLGDYFQSHPALPTVADLDDTDWDDLAADGMNVVRLVTNWSAWEPGRDQLDPTYSAKVHAAVDAPTPCVAPLSDHGTSAARHDWIAR